MLSYEVRHFKVDLSSHLMELGNLIFAGTIISQVFEAREKSLQLISFGFIIGASTYIASYFIRK